MRDLLQDTVNPDVIDSHGRTPLSWALSWAAESGKTGIVLTLLEEGADLLVDNGAYIDAADVSGRTPLLLAAKNGYHSIAEHLLEHGANIESRDDDGNSSLSWAVKMGHRAVIKLLVEHGADVQAEDDRGQTPLAWA
ncbi:ankyrin, partial [Trichoderma citrinoviride]